jgi:hypothetical protein
MKKQELKLKSNKIISIILKNKIHDNRSKNKENSSFITDKLCLREDVSQFINIGYKLSISSIEKSEY